MCFINFIFLFYQIKKKFLKPYDDSLYSNLKQFDSEVIDHCKSITTAESRFKMEYVKFIYFFVVYIYLKF